MDCKGILNTRVATTDIASDSTQAFFTFLMAHLLRSIGPEPSARSYFFPPQDPEIFLKDTQSFTYAVIYLVRTWYNNK